MWEGRLGWMAVEGTGSKTKNSERRGSIGRWVGSKIGQDHEGSYNNTLI